MSDLPHDPRDCHRAISNALCAPCFEWPQSDLPLAALHMAELFVRVQRSATDEASWALDSLSVILAMGQDVAGAQTEAAAAVRKLARHGCGDYRDLDAEQERRTAAIKAGKPLPHEPTAGDVAAAQRILAALGHQAWPVAEIVRVLRDTEADAG